MFGFEEIKNNKEEAIRLINKMIVNEINYINKLCFVYSGMKENHPDKFRQNLNALLKELNNLKYLKKDFTNSVGEDYEDILNEKILSLSELKAMSEEMICDDIDEMINLLVEESEANAMDMENKIECLSSLDTMVFDGFISKIRDINDETIDYIVKIIRDVNKNNKGGR